MRKQLVFLCTLAVVVLDSHLFARAIMIQNKTDKVVYGALYYVEGKSNDDIVGDAQRYESVIVFPPHSKQQLERPPKKLYGRILSRRWYDRDLYVSLDQKVLTEFVPKGSLPSVNVGYLAGSDFYIEELGEGVGVFSQKGSDLITVHNELDSDIFAALYYVQGRSDDQQGGDGVRFANVIKVPKKSSASVLRGPQKCRHFINTLCSHFDDRDLYFSLNEDDLHTIVPKGKLPFVNVGNTKGSIFYVNQTDVELAGYNLVSRGLQPITQKISGFSKQIVDELRKDFSHHTHDNKQASVRVSNDISAEEKSYLNKRLPRVKKALEKLLGTTLADDEVPRIAICASGGGYRAAISTLGFLEGADSFSLLDGCVYQAALSGSTWATAGWIQSGMPLRKYIDLISKQSADLVTDSSKQAREQITKVLLRRIAFGQSISVIDVFGALLAQKFLKTPEVENPQEIVLEDQAARIADASYFFPLYAAVIDRQPYSWLEFNPYEIGDIGAQGYLPPWAFGRVFSGGLSQDFASPLPLAFFLGLWGSAMSANPQDITRALQDTIEPVSHIFGMEVPSGELVVQIENYLKRVPQFSRKRAYSAVIPNWMAGLPGKEQYIDQFTIVDGGADLVLPVPLLMRPARQVSLIILLDMSDRVKDAPALHNVEQFAKKHGWKFPEIDYAATSNICSVHKSEDIDTPTIIYLPLMKNKSYQSGWDPSKDKFTGTLNFSYSENQVLLLSGLTAFNMQESKDTIIDAIKHVVDLKRSSKPS